MKRLGLCLFFLGLVLVVFPVVAMAEGEGLPGALYDWTSLVTVGGATAAVLLIVQYAKVPLDKVWKVPTRLVVFLIALLVLLCAQGFTAGIAWADVPLVLLNAVVVAMAAMGSYEVTFGRREET